MSKRLLLSLVTLLVVACVWLSLALIPAPFALLASRTASPQPTPVDLGFTTPTPASGLIPTQAAENLPPEIARQMDNIQQQVVELRGLAPRAPLLRQLLTPEQLRKKVSEDFFKDYSTEEAREDVLVMSVFGLLEPGYNLYTLYHELYSEQVAGYYDDESKTMYVVRENDFLGPQRTTYAHEFIHALQDQHYDMQDGLKLTDETCEQDSEYCAAVSALIEGDASLGERVWLWQYATEEDRQQIIDFYQGYQSPVFDAAPSFLKEDFFFPYIQGLEFVESLYDIGGWQAIDAAYADPPLSTTHILHPEKYPGHQPLDTSLPDLLPTLGPEWKQIDDNVLGEWYTYLVLAHGWQPSARLATVTGRQAATGWAGDRYRIYHNSASQQTVLVQRWRWENSAEADEFWNAFQDYARSRWGVRTTRVDTQLTWTDAPDGEVTLLQYSRETLWLIAPNAAISAAIMDELDAHLEQDS